MFDTETEVGKSKDLFQINIHFEDFIHELEKILDAYESRLAGEAERISNMIQEEKLQKIMFCFIENFVKVENEVKDDSGCLKFIDIWDSLENHPRLKEI